MALPGLRRGGFGVGMEKTLEVTPCDLSRALPYLVNVTRPKSDTSNGLATVQDVCRNAQVFAVTCEGQTVGAYAVEPLEFDRGVCLWVQAGAGHLDGVDLSQTIIRVIEGQAQQIGAKQVAMLTKRRGLAKKLSAMGWQIAAIKMVKKI